MLQVAQKASIKHGNSHSLTHPPLHPHTLPLHSHSLSSSLLLALLVVVVLLLLLLLSVPHEEGSNDTVHQPVQIAVHTHLDGG